MSHDSITATLPTHDPGARGVRVPGLASLFRRGTARRHHLAERQRHERRDTSDAYIDRYGTVELPVDVVAALMR